MQQEKEEIVKPIKTVKRVVEAKENNTPFYIAIAVLTVIIIELVYML